MIKNDIRIEFNNNICKNFLKEHPFCQYCGQPTQHIHHLIPIAKGGDNRVSNLIPLCTECHGLIHDKHFTEEWKELQRIGIEKAKAEGRYKGGQSKPKPNNWLKLYNDYLLKKYTKVSLAKELKISRPTLDKWIKEETRKNDK